ncbi:unnamed protein product [Jaminaea pallidilutea]
MDLAHRHSVEAEFAARMEVQLLAITVRNNNFTSSSRSEVRQAQRTSNILHVILQTPSSIIGFSYQHSS